MIFPPCFSIRVTSLSLSYTLCHPAGCTAEVETTPELLTSLKSGGGVKVHTTSEPGASAVFSIALNGFAEALEVEPFEPKKPTTPMTPMRCDQGLSGRSLFALGCSLVR